MVVTGQEMLQVILCQFTRKQQRSRKIVRDQRGATALEFGLVAPVFFLIFVGIIEVGLIMFGVTTVETATAIAAREAAIGAASGTPPADLQDNIRQRVRDIAGGLVNGNSIVVTTAVDTDYGDLGLQEPCIPENPTNPCNCPSGNFEDYDGDGVFDCTIAPLNLGGPGDIISIKTSYAYAFFTPLVGNLLGNASGRLIFESVAYYRNEPGSGT
jgi:Flp pilus assembly pilin Flp